MLLGITGVILLSGTKKMRKTIFIRYTVAAKLVMVMFMLIGTANTNGQSLTKAQDTSVTGKPTSLITVVVTPAAVVSADPVAILKSARLIHVRSSSLLVGEAVIEDKLKKRQEFQLLGLMLTRDVHSADLILEVRHDLFTMYVYTAIDPRTKVVVATGKLSSLGGTVAGKVAERFLKQLVRARTGP